MRKRTKRRSATLAASKSKSNPALEAAVKTSLRAALAAARSTQPSPAGYDGWVWVMTPDKAVAKHIRGVSKRKDRGMYRGFFPRVKDANSIVQTEKACDAFSKSMRDHGHPVYCKTNID